MTEDLQELLLRKQQLVARSADLRERLMAQTAGFSPVLSMAYRLTRGLGTLRQHPEWVAGALAVVAVVRPRFAWRWARRGLLGWRTWQSVRGGLLGSVDGHQAVRQNGRSHN